MISSGQIHAEPGIRQSVRVLSWAPVVVVVGVDHIGRRVGGVVGAGAGHPRGFGGRRSA